MDAASTSPPPPPSGENGSLERQLKDFLRRAQLSFAGPPAETAGGGGGGTEPGTEVDEEARRRQRLEAVKAFQLKPREVKAYLDRFVVQQDQAKKALSVAVCDHYNHVRRCLEDPAAAGRDRAKHNIILLGPTGVGKTYLMRHIARLVGVPFVKADATKFSETGYVGHDVEDLVRDLVKAAGGDVELASYGIIYLDEVDKIAASPGVPGKDVSGRGVQVNLLKLMEETDVGLFSQTDLIGQMQAIMDMQRGRAPTQRTINTRHILFIVSGAFTLLADQVRRRLQSSPIGFEGRAGGAMPEGACLRRAETRDFVDYGFEPEFVGRLPVRVVCDALSVDDLERILTRSEENILAQYEEDFRGYGIGLKTTPEALRRVAELGHAEGTGARGLMTVLERTLRGFKFDLPSTPVKRFTLAGADVDDPDGALKKLLASGAHLQRDAVGRELDAFAEAFSLRHGLRVSFTPAARRCVAEACKRLDLSASQWCERSLKDLEYALKLVARNTGASSFKLTRRLVENPEQALSKKVAESFMGERDTGADDAP